MLRSLVVGFGLLSSFAIAAPRPNIIFVLADDLGPGDLGVTWQNGRTGTQKFVTPHLDAFGNEGVRLTRHYSPAPVCAPARASLQLGVHQGHANVRDNQFDKVLDDNHTLGSVLRSAGYSTAAIGKWGLGGKENVNYPGHPLQRGYDYFFGVLEHGDAHTHYPKDVPLGSVDDIEVEDGTTNVTEQLDKAYSTDLFTARSKKWIVDQHTATPEKPFFLYLAYTAPHARLQVPTQPYPTGWGVNGGLQWTGTPGAVINTASGIIDSYIHPDYADTDWPEAEKRHATMIRRLDDSVYDLEKTLEDLGIAENTLIVFTSDNGAHNEAGSGGAFTQDPKFFQSYGPYDGIKRDMWEGGVRMATLVRWPAAIPANRVNATASQFHDWMATFADLAGVPKPARSDGQSIVPDLTGVGERKPSLIYSEYNYAGSTPNYPDFETARRSAARNEMQFVQIGDFKGIRNNITGHQATDFLIYNVATDLKETTNLSGQPGVPTQQEFKDRALQVRRVGGEAARIYDAELVPSLVAPPQVKRGFAYQVFSQGYQWVPDFENATAASSGEATVLDPGLAPVDTDYGLFFHGYLKVPADGTYTFSIQTDTGAFVRLHDAQLLDADAGYVPGSEVTSSIPLKAGLHPLRIYYRHGSGSTPVLSLKWSGPGIAKQEIPATALYVEGVPGPSVPVAVRDAAVTNGGKASPGAPVTIDVLANDSDDDGGPISLLSVAHPAHGTAVIDQGKVVYTPIAGFFGSDHFTYRISDGINEVSAPVTVEVVQPLGTSLWLPFDEGQGIEIREAGGRIVSSLTGGASRTEGKRGGAVQFDGVTQQITITGYTPPIGKAARTLTAWIKVASVQPELSAWLSYGSNTNGTRYSARIDTGKLRLEVQGGWILGTTHIADNIWHHVAIVVSDANNDGTTNVSETKLYVDGVQEVTTTSARAIVSNADLALTLGGSPHGAGYNFAGALDEVRLEPRALSQAEVVARANEPVERNAWLYRFTGNATPDDAAWKEDADHDGYGTLLEYALGGTPFEQDQLGPQLLKADEVTYIFNRRRSGLAPQAYQVEVSDSLAEGSWTVPPDTTFSVEPHPDLPDFDRVTAHLSVSSSGRQFVRLRVAP